MRRVLAALAMLAGVLLQPANAQTNSTVDPAILVADSIFVGADRVLTASGNVEAFQGGIRMTASKVVYDARTGKLLIEGPITLRDSESVVILADSAELDADLTEGILMGARLVLDQQLQLAALQMDRVDGRLTQLYKTVATSCRICDDGRPPLWSIRATRTVHDQEARQLYFDNAQFRVLDVPVFYMPRLRLPDPTLDRASGFLVPVLRTNTRLGYGIQIPYFQRIGDHADLTFYPFFSSESTTLGFRYRQAFRTGDVQANAALSNDTLLPGETRGYIFADGSFDLPRDFRLSFDLEAVTDESYLLDYEFSEKDRLDSAITLERTRPDRYFSFGLINYQSLRDGEDNSTLPTIIGDLTLDRRFDVPGIGGVGRFGFDVHAHYRYSNLDVDGRDIARATAEAGWHNAWTLPLGLRLSTDAAVFLDWFGVDQDMAYADADFQVTPTVTTALRWPLIRKAGSGTTDILEPVVQVGWSGQNDAATPNDESTLVEFDEGNLFDISRFPAGDRRERGLQAAVGANWTRLHESGAAAHLTFGLVTRKVADADFTESSGLMGLRSDWLVAGQITLPEGLQMTARALFDDDLAFSKAEARADWQGRRASLSGGYVWLIADPAEDRLENVSELTVDAGYQLSRHWATAADWRYDIAADKLARAGLKLTYENECAEINLSVSRRFTSSAILEPSTNFSLTVGLNGFSTGQSGKDFTRTCRQ